MEVETIVVVFQTSLSSASSSCSSGASLQVLVDRSSPTFVHRQIPQVAFRELVHLNHTNTRKAAFFLSNMLRTTVVRRCWCLPDLLRCVCVCVRWRLEPSMSHRPAVPVLEEAGSGSSVSAASLESSHMWSMKIS